MDTIRYFSKRLRSKLDEMSRYPVTVIEAPAGYGKTTAVRKALDDLEDADVYYYTTLKEDGFSAYHRLCTAITFVDPETGEKMLEEGFPNRTNIDRITKLIRELKVDQETWLVLDNLHYLQRALDTRIIQAFTEHRAGLLHIVLVTQYLSGLRYLFYENPHVHLIRVKDFALDVDDINDFYHSNGVTLSPEEPIAIYEKTEGWTVAVALLLQSALELGSRETNTDISALLYSLFWVKLSDEERDALMPLALFDNLTASESDQLWRMEDSAELHKLILRTPFIVHDGMHNRYFIHNILSTFLLTILNTESDEKKKEVYTRAGNLYYSMQRHNDAIRLFYQIADYERILQSDLLHLEFSFFDDKPFYEIAEEILLKCEPEILEKYPLSLLRLAYYSFNSHRRDLFNTAMQVAHHAIWKSDDEHNRGEWHLMAALYHFPDLTKMESEYEKASNLLKGRSRVLRKELPYLYGCPSMWVLFYEKPGKGDEIGEQLSKMVLLYNELTGGHGAGSDTLYKGEIAYMRLRFSEARVHAFETLYLAEQYQNVTIAFGAAVLLGRIAIATKDPLGIDEAVNYIEMKASTYPFMAGSETNYALLQIARFLLQAVTGEQERISKWVQHETTHHTQTAFTSWIIAYEKTLHFLRSEDYEQAVGLLRSLGHQPDLLHNTATRYFLNIGLALAYARLDMREQAIETIQKIVAVAKPDGLLTSMIRYREQFEPFLTDPDIVKQHEKFVQKVLQGVPLALPEKRSAQKIAYSDKMPDSLTEREVEIAYLVLEGLRNKEIAEKLYISESTVKNHLRSIYSKLDIDRRGQLANLLR